MGRFNNAGIAGEGSREGYEKSEDVEKYSQQLLRSEFKEWDDILRTNVTSHYVRLISIRAGFAMFFKPGSSLY
jgi:NAD(P)-dependent dehydrogenase (short-subunit alcohol dehydrogenase family)